MSQGVVYGDYYLLGRLAMGGMAEVFLAKRLLPEGGDDLLALKRTLPQFSSQPDFVSMFTDEARIARGLRHANICQVFDEGEAGEQLYLVMEFIHGKDLKILQHRASQRGEQVPARFIAFVMARIAQALDFAHHKQNERGEPENIVHRDVSPQNILLSYDGVPKLIDFGIAKAKDRIAKTRVGIVKGKFAYMSPEQAMGNEVDSRTDIFAMGVVLYELLCGQPPFKGSSDFSTLKRIASAEYVPPEQIVPDLAPRLVKIIERCLARERGARYARAADLSADLDRYLVDEGGRQVNEAALSSYMRKLFRDDYIHETARIREFKAIEVPRAESRTRQHGTADGAQTLETGVGERGQEGSAAVAATLDLAAGFGGEVTGLSDLLGRGARESGPAADDAPTALLTNAEFDGAVTDEVPGPPSLMAAVAASEFDEPTREVGTMEHLVRQLKDDGAAGTSAGAAVFTEATREMNAAAMLAQIGAPQAKARISAEEMTDEIMVQPHSASLDLAESNEELLRSLEKVEAEAAELLHEEVDIGDLEIDEFSTPGSPARSGWSEAGGEEPSSDSELWSLSASFRRHSPLLTSGEKRILWFAGVLGACAVYGSWWYATHPL